MGIITLLTDFGTRDEYVGVVKGVILGIHPQAAIVDISHHIAPQDIVQAADMLKSAYGWFPRGTVHLAVVDPGVGSRRAIIAAQYAGYTFVAPDNGLLNVLWEDGRPQTLVRVENSRFFLHPVGMTFHGRDIFAPVAAHLSLGIPLNALGPAVDPSSLAAVDVRRAVWDRQRDQIIGNVTGSDRFGNLLTNIDASLIDRFLGHHQGSTAIVRLGETRIEGIKSTYAQCPGGELMALVGSRNRLEIAVNGGSAAQRYQPASDLTVSIGVI